MYEVKTESDQEHCQPHNILSQLLHHTRCFRFYGVLWKLIKEACQIRTFLHHNAAVTWKNKSCNVEAKLDITKIFMFSQRSLISLRIRTEGFLYLHDNIQN